MAKILIVEDDLELSNFVRSYLEFENHTVDLFHTGGIGRENLLKSRHDLVILDWEIPEVSGVEMLKEFRDKGGITPVLMLTGKDQVADKAEGLDCGADDYLTKPFDMKELGARIRALLRRGAAEPKLPAIADVRLDKASQRALQGGRSVALTHRELQFLEYLVEHQDERLTTGEYVQRVFAGEPGITPEVVKSTVLRLRKKLDPTGAFICPHLFQRPDDDGDANQDGESSGSRINYDDLDLLTGTTLNGKYELLELLGGGGTGLVYKAKHNELGTLVAVKVLISHLAFGTENVRRFKREAKTVIGFTHQNILKVLDFGTSIEGTPYLVMELVHGESLADAITRRGPLPVAETIDILCQICNGLTYAHENGAIHRDIKPSNIMLVPAINQSATNQSWLVKVVDFGIAKTFKTDQSTEKLTTTGEVLGSPPYMSPEQCRGFALDQRTDIYSLGCTIYEMLVAKHAFGGEDPLGVMWKQVTMQPPHLVRDDLEAPLRERLDLIIMKCLAKEQDKRYQSVAELKSDLQAVMSGDDPGLAGRAGTLMDLLALQLQNGKRAILRLFGRLT